MADSLFSADPPSLENDDAPFPGGLSLHTLIQPQVAGRITHIRRYRPVTAPSFEIGSLWTRTNEGAGAQVAESVDWQGSGEEVGSSGWDVALLATPISVAALAKVYACLTTDRFVSATDPSKPFKNGDVTSPGGLLVGPGDDTGTPQRNGRFNADNGATPSYPNASGGNCYFIDVVFVEGIELSPAEMTLTAVPLTAVPGVVTVQLTSAELALSAVTVSPTAGSVTVALTAATLTLAAIALNVTARAMVTRPSVGTITRPNTGTISRP